ncbi:SHOCT domain-containing protein [Sulfurimonas sp.]|uniref:SHOCT domain-containing protein n=1 Tax=Sulfurimonas sp. TaxID=2022749 RepID=UPI003565327C
MMNDYFGYHGLGMGFGWIGLLVIVFFIIYIMKNDNNSSELSAKEKLDKRYADGKIDTKEYLERKKNLEE